MTGPTARGSVPEISVAALRALQRRDARFMNSAMMVTLGGAVVADALEDAGCDCPQAYEVLRSGRSQFRGAWVIDHILKRR